MQEVNRAFDLAVKAILHPRRPRPRTRRRPPSASPVTARRSPPPAEPPDRAGLPSFSIDLLPGPGVRGAAVVVGWLGEVLIDDPPYLLDAYLNEPAECWCRMELLPEAGASTVSLTVVGLEGEDAPPVEDVRDVLIASLGQLGRWEEPDA